MEQFEELYTDAESVNLSEDQKQQLVAESLSKRLAWLDMTRQYREDAIEVRQLYLENRPDSQQFTTPDSEMDSKSRVRLPVVAQSVDSTLAQQHLGTFPTDERFFKTIPLNDLSKEKQIIYEDSVEKRLSLVNFIHNTKMDRMNAMLDGVSVAWHPYVKKNRRRAVYKPRMVFGIPIGKPRKSYVDEAYIEGTGFIPLSLEDWWIDPTVDDFDEACLIWRRWIPVDALKGNKDFENTEDVTPYGTALDDGDSRIRENYDLMGFDVDLSKEEQQLGRELAMLFEEWGDFYIDGELYENHVLVYSNDSLFHGFYPNPFDHGRKPFSITPYIPVPGTLMGKSLGKDIVPLAHAYDAFLNGAIDVVNSAAGPVWTYLTSDDALVQMFGDGKKVVEPGMVFPVMSHDSLKPYMADLANLNVVGQLMQKVKEEIRETTGGVPYATGGLSGADQDRTATEVNTLASGTSTRYQDLIQNYEENKLKPYLWMWFENDRQFKEEPILSDGDVVTADMLKQMDLEFEVIGSKTAMSQSREGEALMWLINTIPNLLSLGVFQLKQDMSLIDAAGVVKQLGRSQGLRNIDDYLETVMTQEEMEQGGGNPLEELLNGLGQVDPTGAPGAMGALPEELGMAGPMPGPIA